MHLIRIENPNCHLDPGGALIVTLTSSVEGFGKSTPFRIQAWSKGMAVSIGNGNGSVEEPAEGLYFDFHGTSIRCGRAIDRFTQDTPDSVLQSTKPFGFLRFPLIQWACRDPRAADLLAHNPLLLWMLIAYAFRESKTDSFVEDALSIPQAEILCRITGTGSKSAVKLLRKLETKEYDRSVLRTLEYAIRSPKEWGAIRHWPSIPLAVLAAVQANPELHTLYALRRGADEECWDAVKSLELARLIRDTLLMARQVGLGDKTKEWLEQRATLPEIRQRHDALLQKLNEKSKPKECWKEGLRELVPGKRRFPVSPPLPGNDYILPIRTEEDLRAEGVFMRNCVGAYVPLVKHGFCYIYRVIFPQRATLELVNKAYPRKLLDLTEPGQIELPPLTNDQMSRIMNWSDGIELGQLKCHANRAVATATLEAVEEWLEMASARQATPVSQRVRC